MDCDKAIHRVYEYLDGELTVWKRRGDHPPPRRVPALRRGLRLRDRAAPGRSSRSAARRSPTSLRRRIAEALGFGETEPAAHPEPVASDRPERRPLGWSAVRSSRELRSDSVKPSAIMLA